MKLQLGHIVEESINDSVSVDLGIDHWCHWEQRFVGSRTEMGTLENHVRVTEKVRVCQKRWPEGAGGQGATPRPDYKYAECHRKYVKYH